MQQHEVLLVSSQQRDAKQHNTLYSTFWDFQQRSSPNYYRCIYFPVDESQPCFTWLLFDGDRGSHHPNHADLVHHASGSPMGSICFNVQRGISPPCHLNNMLVIQYDQDMVANNQPNNRCLWNMMASHSLAANWKESYVGHAHKYTYGHEKFDKEDEKLGGGSFLPIALDLDTISLGPFIAHLAWHAAGIRVGD
jgi:hypothetical protein